MSVKKTHLEPASGWVFYFSLCLLALALLVPLRGEASSCKGQIYEAFSQGLIRSCPPGAYTGKSAIPQLRPSHAQESALVAPSLWDRGNRSPAPVLALRSGPAKRFSDFFRATDPESDAPTALHSLRQDPLLSKLSPGSPRQWPIRPPPSPSIV
ncbi:MAG: hypothetical protein V4498_09065 [candidate division FCPU426 bacterium]